MGNNDSLRQFEIGSFQFAATAQKFARPKPRKLTHILVVDDEKRHRESLQDLISLAGFKVSIAGNGKEALIALDSSSYDLLLLDLRMPEVDGHQVMDYIHEKRIATGVIVISGEPSWDEASKTLRRGADDFIRKPYAPDEVITAIENSLKKRQLEEENRLIQKQLEASERLHRFIVNHSPDLIYILDQEGRFRYLNDHVENLLGYRKQELLNQHFDMLLHENDEAKFKHVMNERRTGDRMSRNVELRLKTRSAPNVDDRPAKSSVIIELTSMGVYSGTDNTDKLFVGTYGVARDITERKQAEDLINYQAYHDLLTGLPNRALFKDRLGLAIKQAARNKSKLAVMFLDLDRFKLVNDTLGHTQGDQLLQSVAKRIQGCIRDGDTLCRIGGDEFTLLLPYIHNDQDTANIAEKILAALKIPFVVHNHELFVRASIGIAIFPDHSNDIDSLIKQADMAMYEVKHKGRDNYGFYSAAMDAKYTYKLSIENDLRRALEEGQFEVYYQPQVRISDRSFASMEALIRWKHPERGYIEPTAFIPLAEENGLIVPIGRWILDRVLTDISKWHEQGLRLSYVAVNISAAQLEHPEFVDSVLAMLERYRIPGSVLELEITENIIMKDMQRVVEQLKRLVAHQVKIAIDDFGTGYSSLSYLQTLPINTLKMDQSFVSDIDSHLKEDSIISAIAAMAKGLQLKLVAEGVEREVQAQYLNRIGCEQAQGFLFSTPLPYTEATDYLLVNAGIK